MLFTKLILAIALAVLSAFGGGPRSVASHKGHQMSKEQSAPEPCDPTAAEITYGPYGPCGDDFSVIPRPLSH
jgi:hypothetical protein